MRVNDANIRGLSVGGAEGAKETERVAQAGRALQSGGTAATSGADEVQLSELGAALSGFLAAIRGDNTSQRLESLAAAIESGKYQVDAFAVSTSLIDDALAATALEKGEG